MKNTHRLIVFGIFTILVLTSFLINNGTISFNIIGRGDRVPKIKVKDQFIAS